MIHELKCWSAYYKLTKLGVKTFEIRNDDRHFKVGDVLHLREYDHIRMEYIPNDLYAEVIYILSDFEGLQSHYVAMQIRVMNEFEVVELLEREGVSLIA